MHPSRESVDTPLPKWAVEYPYFDGFIHPWTAEGSLLKGLTIRGTGQASCSATSEQTRTPDALRCFSWNGRILDPCFPRPSRPNVAACATQPGAKAFVRIMIR
jgi:hypothetical protein